MELREPAALPDIPPFVSTIRASTTTSDDPDPSLTRTWEWTEADQRALRSDGQSVWEEYVKRSAEEQCYFNYLCFDRGLRWVCREIRRP